MIYVRSQISIARPPASVFAFVTDPSKSLLWQSALAEMHAEPGMPAGSTGTAVMQVLGRRIQTRFDVLDNDGKSFYRARSRHGPVQYTTTQRVEDLRAGSLFVNETEIDAGTVFRLAEPALESIAQARFDSDLTTLKQILESEDGQLSR